MNKEMIKGNVLEDCYYKVSHPTGLDIYLYPKEGFAGTYAIFSTKYGSIDTKFKLSNNEKVHEVPAGIAHFLEHKLFESEDGDAFSRYAKTGASANAFTSFESTRYLFSTTQNMYESLEILLDFVQSPYFTKETVEKEQGIIAQEIKMYEDDPNWRVMFNLLGAIYHNHTVKEDIAGTVESISQITPEYLYDCYKTFYNLHNMSLVVAGNMDVDKVLELCDKMLKPCENVEIQRYFEKEPDEVVTNYVEQRLPVTLPLFQIGYKENIVGNKTEKDIASTEILMDIIASSTSPLYKKLYDMEIINEASFSYEHFEGEGFSTIMFGGESKNPQAVLDEINSYIEYLLENGIDEEEFLMAKKITYGTSISGFNSASAIANSIASLAFKDRELFRYIEAFANLTLEDVENRLKELFTKKDPVLSVILPQE